MKVLHVSDSYLPTLGGIELHIRDLAAAQRAAGHEVTIATRTPAGPGVERGARCEDVRRVAGSGRGWIADIAPDVVHAHVSIVSPFALASARRAALAGVPTVVTVHSLWTHAGPLPVLARDLWGMRRWDVVWTAVSDRAAQPVRDLLGVAVHVVPNAVDLERWSPFATVPAPPTPHLVSVMRLTPVKRAMPFARALRRIAKDVDFTATVVGDGPEREVFQRYLRRHGLTDRVRLTGAVGRREVRRLLAEASVFVAPAHRESFGIAALEARASGVPVVASSRSGVSTFIEHGRDGLLGADDRELTQHLRTLLQDEALRDRLARHNRLVRPSFGWDRALLSNDAAYALAVAARGRAARGVPEQVLVG